MPILTVYAREDYPEFLNKAIEIANLMLHDPTVASEFNSKLCANRVTAKHLECDLESQNVLRYMGGPIGQKGKGDIR
jgi:hypothetical protein